MNKRKNSRVPDVLHPSFNKKRNIQSSRLEINHCVLSIVPIPYFREGKIPKIVSTE